MKKMIVGTQNQMSHLSALSLIGCLSVVSLLLSSICMVTADDRKNATELIKSRGFNVDVFEVMSQNYPLRVYHIINPLADSKSLHHTPVIIAHGVSWDATNMMSSSKNSRPRKPKPNERVTLYAMEDGQDDQGLHFYLSNNNYDVWLIESRATNEQNQARLHDGTNKKSFWDFSIDEQALIDLPTQVEFVLARTGVKKVAYIAYSQSTTFMFALLSMRPEFSEKVAAFVALAPVVYTSHLRGFVWPATLAHMYLYPSTAIQTVPEIVRRGANFIITYGCSLTIIKYTLCRYMWKQFSGSDKKANLDSGMTENVLKSTSMKTFEQYIQNAMAHDFRMYDYKDDTRNMEEYGQTVPPLYNVSNINLKSIVLFRGTEDYLSDPEDQMILLSRLRVRPYEDHILEDYSHIDFIVSPTVTRDINEPVLRALDTLTNRTVSKVSHTLGKVNSEVQGTKLHLSAKEDMAAVANTSRTVPNMPSMKR